MYGITRLQCSLDMLLLLMLLLTIMCVVSVVP